MAPRRDGHATRRFFQRVLAEHARPEQVTTDKAKALMEPSRTSWAVSSTTQPCTRTIGSSPTAPD